MLLKVCNLGELKSISCLLILYDISSSFFLRYSKFVLHGPFYYKAWYPVWSWVFIFEARVSYCLLDTWCLRKFPRLGSVVHGNFSFFFSLLFFFSVHWYVKCCYRHVKGFAHKRLVCRKCCVELSWDCMDVTFITLCYIEDSGMVNAKLRWDSHREMSICEIILEFSQDYTERGFHKVIEHFHGGLYSFVLWSGFDLLEYRPPHAERSFYLPMITIESRLAT